MPGNISSHVEYGSAPSNYNPNPTVSLTQCDPDYRQNVMVSSAAYLPPFHLVL